MNCRRWAYVFGRLSCPCDWCWEYRHDVVYPIALATALLIMLLLSDGGGAR